MLNQEVLIKVNVSYQNCYSIRNFRSISETPRNQTKVIKNILHCLNYGSQIGWLIDPEEKSIFVYLPDKPTLVYDDAIAQLPVPEFAQDCRLTVEQLFNFLV